MDRLRILLFLYLTSFQFVKVTDKPNMCVLFWQINHVQVCLHFLCLFHLHDAAHLHEADVFLLYQFAVFFLVTLEDDLMCTILEFSVGHLVIKFIRISQLGFH